MQVILWTTVLKMSPVLQVGDKAVDAIVTIREKPASSKAKAKSVFESLEEGSSDCTDAQEATYISETDLDITDVETLPVTESQGLRGQRSGPVQDPGGLVNAELDSDKRVERSQTPADAAQQEDDGLQLVREIFFTWWRIAMKCGHVATSTLEHCRSVHV